ncbi:MAG TPA: hypothetical protein VM388_09600 [Acidimicrobiales bacterium]|nr:hypothetical protein [Acidimicrobiales bacterium]
MRTDLRQLTAIDTATRFATSEYASLTRAGEPVTWPLTPFAGEDAATIDVSTGLTYPLKAERARREPRVALSFSNPLGSGLDDPPTMVVQGLATVRDADLRANSARYLRESARKLPAAYAKMPDFMLARMAWYWTRIWIEVTPRRILWWPEGRLDREPLRWEAPASLVAPPSDPRPAGVSSGSWAAEPVDWRRRAAGAVDRFGPPVLTTVDASGWPLPLPTQAVVATEDGFEVQAPAGVDIVPGPAFLTFHSHTATMESQDNLGLAGVAAVGAGAVHVRVDRALNDFPLPRNPLRRGVHILRAGRRLRPRLAYEAERRGQRVPAFADLGFRRAR